MATRQRTRFVPAGTAFQQRQRLQGIERRCRSEARSLRQTANQWERLAAKVRAVSDSGRPVTQNLLAEVVNYGPSGFPLTLAARLIGVEPPRSGSDEQNRYDLIIAMCDQGRPPQAEPSAARVAKPAATIANNATTFPPQAAALMTPDAVIAEATSIARSASREQAVKAVKAVRRRVAKLRARIEAEVEEVERLVRLYGEG